jgi:protocatechuate 3,4-dioxygenase beta subunit
VLRRLPWLILVLALGGTLWFLAEEGVFGGFAAGRDEGGAEEVAEGGDSELLVREGAAEEVPVLRGTGNRTREVEATEVEGRAGDPERTPAATEVASTFGPGDVVAFGGVVIDRGGRPVPGTKILIRNAHGARELEVEDGGRFALDVPPGRYDLRFTADTYGALALTRFVVDGATGVEQEFVLQPTVRLTVRVRRAAAAVPEAGVSVVPRDGGDVLEGPTDLEGRVVFEGLIAGRYEVVAALADIEVVTRRLELTTDRELVFDVPAGVALRGRVTSADGDVPVPSAIVEAVVRGPGGISMASRVESESDGRYVLYVPRGPVTSFTVSARDFAPWPTPRERRGVIRSLSRVARGEAVDRDVKLRRGLTVTGRVIDEEGRGVEGVALVFSAGRMAPLRTRSGEDGAYVLSGVIPETYDVAVRTEGWFPPKPVRFRIRRSDGGDPPSYDIVVAPSLAVQGQVVHADGKPAAAARVWIVGGGPVLRGAQNAGRRFETFANRNGWFRFDDIPVGVSVAVRAALGALEARPRVVRTRDGPPEPVELRLAPTALLRGRVNDVSTGRGVAGAEIRVRPRGPPGGRGGGTVRTSADGGFEIQDLLAGGWELTVAHRSYLPAKPQTFTIETGDREVDVFPTLDPGLALGGIVTDVAGRPLAGANVYAGGSTSEGRRVRHNGKTGPDGRFRFTGFERGSYRVFARRTGYRNVSVSDLQGGEERLVLTMRPVRPPP